MSQKSDTAEPPRPSPSQVLCHNARPRSRVPISLVIGRRATKTMTGREQDEYSALRATIRERGTARVCIFVAGIAALGGADDRDGRAGVDARSRRCCRCCCSPACSRRSSRSTSASSASAATSRCFTRADRPVDDRARRSTVEWEHAAMAFGRPRGRRRRRRAVHRAVPARRALQHRAGAAARIPIRSRTDLRRRRPRAVRAARSSSRATRPADSARSISSASSS